MADLDTTSENKKPWYDGLFDTVAEMTGAFLNYDVAKTQAKNTTSTTLDTTPVATTTATPTSSNTMLYMIGGGLLLVVLVILLTRGK